ncbi:polycomb group RING finger protein 5-B isoform X3 [Oreochromis niloticus]|uniref:polycomb group RING finger protein 5-B isoform X3 n=1 Tax=Oreochromis niloticus TaxID=8128 RepID=UPI000DF328D8|nr:polycomb group RING finger protein 5 isoform X3 [Oreochromis niloticus]
MMRFHIRFLMNVGCSYSAWFYVPLFNFEHPPLQTSLHSPVQESFRLERLLLNMSNRHHEKCSLLVSDDSCAFFNETVFLPKLIIFPEQSADEARTHQTTSYHKMPELLRIKKNLTVSEPCLLAWWFPAHRCSLLPACLPASLLGGLGQIRADQFRVSLLTQFTEQTVPEDRTASRWTFLSSSGIRNSGDDGKVSAEVTSS